MIGAPWFSPKKILQEIRREDCPGCTVEPAEFTPRAIPGKSTQPRYKDQPCHGIRFRVIEPGKARPFRTVTAVIAAIHKHHAAELEWLPFFDTLAGGPWLREQLQAGMGAEEIAVKTRPQLDAFDAERPKQYLTWQAMLETGRTVPE